MDGGIEGGRDDMNYFCTIMINNNIRSTEYVLIQVI